MNYLNKIERALQNEHQSPQYFYLFWTGHGEVNESALKNAFSTSLSSYKKFFDEDPKLEDLPFLSFEIQQPLMEVIETFLESKSHEVIEHFCYSPFILIFFHDPKSQEFCILQMNNHVYLDAMSGYLFFRDLSSTYNGTLKKPPSTTRMSDQELVESHLAESNFMQKFQYQLSRFIILLTRKYFYHPPKLKKIYNYTQDTARNRHYSFIQIPPLKKGKRNNFLLASIAKCLLEFKGHLIDHTLVFGIPVNVRKNKECIGNHVALYNITIKKE